MILLIGKRHLAFLAHKMGKEGTYALIIKWHIEVKQRVIYLTSMCACMVEQWQKDIVKGEKILRATKDRKLS